jgi:hypothetical protein
MPDSRPLDALRARLLAAADPQQIFRTPVWGNPRVMTEALRNLKRELGASDAGPPTGDVMQSSLRNFGSTQEVGNFTELKYICYGVTVPVGESQWRVIDRKPLFNKLLSLVEQREAQPKQFRRCYQGLLSGYFGYDHHQPLGSGDTNWQSLRGFLGKKLGPVQHSTAQRGPIPDWLQTLAGHRNLLTDDPCSRYANGLLLGHVDELKELCAGLGIASNSWFWDEALMAYVRTVCAGEDQSFHQGLSGVLKLVNGRSELKLAQALAVQATGMTVARYSRCAEKPEHPDLRDTSLHRIGNPWLNRTAWDAQVKYEPARKMVEGWLKRRLIKDFFELLAHDGAADFRRLNYWLKWEPQITDMWFVLGTDARNNHSTPFMEVRQRMSGQDRTLKDNNQQNNAFVMRIGQLLVIEFGVTGNACYVFAAADFRTNLEKATFTINELKQRGLATRLSHISNWESRFDYELKKLLQGVPMSKGELRSHDTAFAPAHEGQTQVSRRGDWKARHNVNLTVEKLPPNLFTQQTPTGAAPTTDTTLTGSPKILRRTFTQSNFDTIRSMCVQKGIEWEDNRANKGAFWILIPDRDQRLAFSTFLERHGFRHAEGKGFWMKDEE